MRRQAVLSFDAAKWTPATVSWVDTGNNVVIGNYRSKEELHKWLQGSSQSSNMIRNKSHLITIFWSSDLLAS
jgi:hypothetical protein